MMWRAAIVAAVALLLAACAVIQPPVRIGAKSFDEQRILASMIARVLSDRGQRTTIVHCGDTYSCQRALWEGRIDVMVEYTGTALALSGLHDLPADHTGAHIQAFYESIGLRWLVPLGFHNDYAVVVPTARAASLGLDSILDLSQVEGGVRVATHPMHARRPVDGLYPLLRRYGLQLAEPPLLLENPNERYDALLRDQVDIAIAFTTDGFLAGRRLRILRDPLGFFPQYDAAIVVSERALDRHQNLEESLRRIEMRIDSAAMRTLNAEIQLEGRMPERVAADFLQREGIADEQISRAIGRSELILAHAADRSSPDLARAFDTVRSAFPDRSVRQQTATDPVEELVEGNARLAVLGAERFFVRAADGTITRDERIEAVSVIGDRLIHLVARRRLPGAPSSLAGRVGILPSGSTAAQVSEDLLAIIGRVPALRAASKTLMEEVAMGSLDAALLLVDAPDPDIAEMLAENSELTLEPLPIAQLPTAGTTQLPHLRAARLPAGTYAGQKSPIETASAQVVLAAAAPTKNTRTHIGGLASALRAGGVPLLPDEAKALLDAGVAGEMPDPVLPSPWSLRPPPRSEQLKEVGALVETLLNVAAWAFLGLLLTLLLRSLSWRRYP